MEVDWIVYETRMIVRAPGSPAGSRFGTVALVHRFGGYLNTHIHSHNLVTRPLRLIAFIMEPPVVEKMLLHI